MARKTRSDLAWEGIARALVAWETVRSTPEYRDDWERNRRYVEWWSTLSDNERQTIYCNHEVACWLKKMGQKWDFSSGQVLLDPEIEIPLKDRTEFGRLRGRRFGSYLQILSQCPFSMGPAHSVFLQWPHKAWVESDPARRARLQQTKEMRFDTRGRQAGRIVLWVARSASRLAATRQIWEILDIKFKKAAEMGARNSRRVRVQKVVRHIWSEEFLTLSIDPAGNSHRIRRQLAALLERFDDLRKFDARVNTLLDGFLIYRDIQSQSRDKDSAILRHLEREVGKPEAKKAMARHHEKRRNSQSDRDSLYMQADRSLKRAKEFIEGYEYRSYVDPQNDLISWDALSPREAPPCPPVTDPAT